MDGNNRRSKKNNTSKFDAYKKGSKGSKSGKTNVDLANPDKSALPDYAKSTAPSTFNTKASKK